MAGMAMNGDAGAAGVTIARKPRLSLWRIVQMNLGFLGLQFSFGLQQGNMAPIYSYLGAEEAALPLLQASLAEEKATDDKLGKLGQAVAIEEAVQQP